MLCDDSVDSCSSVHIECPIMTTSTEHSCIMECAGINSCDSPTIYAMDGINQFDIISTGLGSIATEIDLFCGYNFNSQCIMDQDCASVCNQTFEETTSGNTEMILGFNNNEDPTIRICSDDQSYTECMIFVDSTTITAECTNDIICRVICMSLSCTTMINGASANTLFIPALSAQVSTKQTFDNDNFILQNQSHHILFKNYTQINVYMYRYIYTLLTK